MRFLTQHLKILRPFNAQKMKLSINDFFSKYEKTRRKTKKSLMENFIFLCGDVKMKPEVYLGKDPVNHLRWKSLRK